MLRRLFLIVSGSVAGLLAATPNPKSADPLYAPLWLYEGRWKITRSGSTNPDELVNQCALVGKYFVCEQRVNGVAGALLVFIPGSKSGHYVSQTILPEGRATGRDDLEITGNKWTYTSRRLENGRAKHYRTINVFTDKNHIHFESAESSDGEKWTTTAAGDEQRLPKKITR